MLSTMYLYYQVNINREQLKSSRDQSMANAFSMVMDMELKVGGNCTLEKPQCKEFLKIQNGPRKLP